MSPVWVGKILNQKFLEPSEQHNLQSPKYDPNPNTKTAGSANAGTGSF